MASTRPWTSCALAGAGLALSGCVAAPLTVVPGQGRSYAQFQSDDAACRAAPATTQATASATTASAYYQCMSARGNLVVADRTVAYPAYLGAPYYAYPYPAYPYSYAYPSYPYGYPYPPPPVRPYVGFGLGIGFGRGW